MPPINDNHGYQEDFLGSGTNQIPLLSIIDRDKYKLVELINDAGNVILDYKNYSVIMDKERKFPILTATNVIGKQFKTVDREGSWKKDKRIDPNSQWGNALYGADKSDFDKGHMTKREDVQWGNNEDEATEAARSTFYYTNAVPQHCRLNRAVWRSIESYILKKEAVKHNLKVIVLTGPVLDDEDPEFVTLVKDEKIQIPVLFWKIVYYLKDDNALCRTAFLVSQKDLLEDNGIVKRSTITRSATDTSGEQYFLRFKKAATYQTGVGLIEDLTGLKFPDAIEYYEEKRPRRLIEQEVNARSSETGEDTLEIKIDNLII